MADFLDVLVIGRSGVDSYLLQIGIGLEDVDMVSGLGAIVAAPLESSHA